MARATKFRIGHAIKQENNIQLDYTKSYLDRSKNYSNGRGGLWDSYDPYIKKILDLIEEYYEITHLNSQSPSRYNEISLPLVIARYKEQLTQELYTIRGQVSRHTIDRQFLNETFEYQWYIDEKFNIFVLTPDGQIEKDLTSDLLNELNDRIKRNESTVNIPGGHYKNSSFSEKLDIEKKVRDIIKKSMGKSK